MKGSNLGITCIPHANMTYHHTEVGETLELVGATFLGSCKAGVGVYSPKAISRAALFEEMGENSQRVHLITKVPTFPRKTK